jgi:urease gamma subunit
MEDVDDVPSLACVELSRSILTRPEVNTGSLFKLIFASGNKTNKSDAVLVIAAAILESIGNSKAAVDILNRSKTVSAFYRSMRLDDEKLRTSFVIMLFAIAPEFVKMIEACVKISLERVQNVTEAPHAESKFFQAASSLAKTGTVSPSEYNSLLRDVTKLEIGSSSNRNSIQLTPTDMIDADDSASQFGSKRKTRIGSAVTTSNLMRYIRDNKAREKPEFYDEFPTASKPIAPSVRQPRLGLGYKVAASEVTTTQTESDLTNALDQLLAPVPGHSHRRHRLTQEQKSKFSKIAKVESADSEDSYATARNSRKDSVVIDPLQYLVTSSDIKESDTVKEREADGFSYMTSGLTKSQQELMDLL